MIDGNEAASPAVKALRLPTQGGVVGKLSEFEVGESLDSWVQMSVK